MSRKKRIWLSILVLPLMLEVVLQGIALCIWFARPSSQLVAAGTEERVLCVGDSWTQGVGSSDPATDSYPALLQKKLRTQLSEKWSVVNCGISGQDSLDCLKQLRRRIDLVKPRIVCLLIGRNDKGSRPEMWSGIDAEPDQFRWCFRLKRLAIIAWTGLVPEPEQLEACESDRVNAAMGDTVTHGEMARGDIYDDAWRRSVRDERWARAVPCESLTVDAKTRSHFVACQTALSVSDYIEAIREARAGLAIQPENPWGVILLVKSLKLTGNWAELESWLLELDHRYRECPSVFLAEALVETTSLMGKSDLSATYCDQFGSLYPESWRIAHVQLKCLLARGEVAGLRSLVDRYLTLRFSNYAIHYVGAAMCKIGEPERCARLLFEMYREHGDSNLLLRQLRTRVWNLPRAAYQRALTDWECVGLEAEVFAEVATQAYAGHKDLGPLATVLDFHLQQAAELCRRHGVELFVMNYARPKLVFDGLRQKIAAARSWVEFVSISDAFRRACEPAGTKMMAFFSSDGHLNDRGYEVFASEVADALVEHVRIR